MKYIFLDFEFTTFKTKKMNQEKKQEIISIGAVKTDEKGIIIDTYYSLVKPTEHKFLSEYCISLTKITQEEINCSNSIEIEIFDFYNWVYSDNDIIKIYTWGIWDKIILNAELNRKNIDLYFNLINIQNDISKFISNLDDCSISLLNAKKYFLLGDCISHNSLNDAEDLYNIFFAYLNQKKIKKI